MQIENLINKSTDTKNTDTKTINDMTAGMRVSDYIKTDSSDNMSKKAAVVGSSNHRLKTKPGTTMAQIWQKIC